MVTDRPIRLELYVRSLHAGAAGPQQERAIEGLGKLATSGRIDDHRVLVWGDRMPGSPAEARTDAGLFALNRAAVFTEWATLNALAVDRFEHAEIESHLLGERYRTLTVPVMTLAEYEGDDLRFVAPVSGPDGTVTVLDRLDQLADEADPTAGYEVLPRAYTDPPRGLTLAPPEREG